MQEKVSVVSIKHLCDIGNCVEDRPVLNDFLEVWTRFHSEKTSSKVQKTLVKRFAPDPRP